MRFVVSSNRMRRLNQVSAIGLIAIVSAGCSSDFARFDAGQYTASIAAPQNTAPVNNPYPGDVDPVTTASVRRTGVRPPAVDRPPYPHSGLGGRTSKVTQQNVANTDYRTPNIQRPKIQRPNIARPSVVRPPQKQPTTYNTYNTYNTYQSSSTTKPLAYQQRSTAKPVQLTRPGARNHVPQVDQITTSTIRRTNLAPAKPLAPRRTKIVNPAPNNVGATGWTGTGGTRVTVREGENLYNISKRYGVPVNELMKVNRITDANSVNAGQQIIIPTYVYSSSAPISAPDNNPKTRASRASKGYIGEVRQTNVGVPTRAPQNIRPGLAKIELPPRKQPNDNVLGQTYTVAGGDNLGSIANQHKTSIGALKVANNLSDSNIRIGQKLIIPASGSSKRVVGLAPMRTDRVVTGSTPKPYTKPSASASIRTKEVSTKAPARSGIETFRWPATGKVFSKFGDRREGERNDGIDISVPVGTSVKAAENGVVIYSGSELQNYGKLLLVRHDGGWVSAYAHNDSLKVQRGAKVRRGQEIAKSGRTGNATRPMLHFELRKDANPVNPTNYLR